MNAEDACIKRNQKRCILRIPAFAAYKVVRWLEFTHQHTQAHTHTLDECKHTDTHLHRPRCHRIATFLCGAIIQHLYVQCCYLGYFRAKSGQENKTINEKQLR